MGKQGLDVFVPAFRPGGLPAVFQGREGGGKQSGEEGKNVSVRHFFVCVRRAMFVEWTGYALLLRLV